MAQEVANRDLEYLRSLHRAYAERHAHGTSLPLGLRDDLDMHRGGEGGPLLIVAPAGMVQLSEWALSSVGEQSRGPTVVHFTGLDQEKEPAVDLVRHLMLEIGDMYDVPSPLPISADSLLDSFATWLWYVRNRTLIFLDSLERLSDADHRLTWLPERLPPRVRLVATTSEEEIARSAEARGWIVRRIRPPSLSERQNRVRGLMARHPEDHAWRGYHRPLQSRNSIAPVLLRGRPDEVRRIEVDRETAEEVDRILATGSIVDLYMPLLRRLEHEFGRTLSRRIIALLLTSTSGLTEQDLSALGPIRSEQLSEFLDAIDSAIIRVGDRIVLFQSAFADVVERVWQIEERRELHEELASWLTTRPLTHDVVRELLRQVAASENEEQMLGHLTDPALLTYAWRELRYELLRHVRPRRSIAELPERIVDSVVQRASSGTTPLSDLVDFAGAAGSLLQSIGEVDAAERVYREVVEVTDDDTADPEQRASLLIRWAAIRGDRGSPAEGAELLGGALRVLEDRENSDVKAAAYNTLASLSFFRGDLSGARKCFLESLKIYRRTGNHHEEVRVTGNLGVLSLQTGDCPDALKRFRRMLDYATAIGDVLMEAQAASNLAAVCETIGEYQEAQQLLERSLGIAQAIDNRQQIAAAHGNLGGLLHRLHLLDEAIHHTEKQQEIAAAIDDRRQQIDALEKDALIRTMRCEYHQAFDSLHRAFDLVARLDDPGRSAALFCSAGHVALRAGEAEVARGHYEELLRYAEEEDLEEIRCEALLGLAHVCRVEGRLQEGRDRLDDLCRLETLPAELRNEACGYRGVITLALGESAAAESDLDPAIEESRKELPTFDLAVWLLCKGEALLERGESEEAERCLREVGAMRLTSRNRELHQTLESALERLRPIRD